MNGFFQFIPASCLLCLQAVYCFILSTNSSVFPSMCHATTVFRVEKHQCSWKPLKQQCGVLLLPFTAELGDPSAETAALALLPDSSEDKPTVDVTNLSPSVHMESSIDEKTDDEDVSAKTSVESLREKNENNNNSVYLSQQRGWYLNFVHYQWFVSYTMWKFDFNERLAGWFFYVTAWRQLLQLHIPILTYCNQLC